MTNIFIACKNDIFYKAIEPTLNENEIFVSCFFKMHPQTLKNNFLEAMKNEFSTCTPKPDIVLMDANWNTYEVTGTDIFKTFATFENLKIIVSTTSLDERISTIFQNLGATAYMVKTFGYEHILSTLKAVLNVNSCLSA